MRGKKQYPLAEFLNFSTIKRTRSSHKESDNNGTSLSSSDDESTPRYKKSYGVNIKSKLDKVMERRRGELIVADNALFKIGKNLLNLY